MREKEKYVYISKMSFHVYLFQLVVCSPEIPGLVHYCVSRDSMAEGTVCGKAQRQEVAFAALAPS